VTCARVASEMLKSTSPAEFLTVGFALNNVDRQYLPGRGFALPTAYTPRRKVYSRINCFSFDQFHGFQGVIPDKIEHILNIPSWVPNRGAQPQTTIFQPIPDVRQARVNSLERGMFTG
jgi:hypothetical protein